jgi:hypothetical protein
MFPWDIFTQTLVKNSVPWRLINRLTSIEDEELRAELVGLISEGEHSVDEILEIIDRPTLAEGTAGSPEGSEGAAETEEPDEVKEKFSFLRTKLGKVVGVADVMNQALEPFGDDFQEITNALDIVAGKPKMYDKAKEMLDESLERIGEVEHALTKLMEVIKKAT